MKKISCLFFALAILLSDVMCAVVAFKYAKCFGVLKMQDIAHLPLLLFYGQFLF